MRWYSEQPAKEGNSNGNSNSNGNGNGQNKAAEPSDEASKLKAQIEAKDKEIIDLKVCTCLFHLHAKLYQMLIAT
jgi:hypothetical protein